MPAVSWRDEMSRAGTATLEEGERMGRYVLDFEDIDQTQVAVVGGKGANLGELSRIEGIWLLRDAGRLPADHDNGAPDR